MKNEYIEMFPLETRIKKNSQKFHNKLATIVVVPPELRKVPGISFYKLMLGVDCTCDHIINMVKKLIIDSKFYILDHRGCLLKCFSECHIAEDGNVYLYPIKY